MSDAECPPNKTNAFDLTTGSGNIQEPEISVSQNDGNSTGLDEQRDVLQDVNFAELSDNERVLLYEKGVQFKRKQSTRHALHCLLGCLQGLKDGSRFPMLPDCLHHIADIYGAEGDCIHCFLGKDENAISFAQAEKLYYETALINVGTTTEHLKDADQKSTKDPKVDRSGENNGDVSSPGPAEAPESEESEESETVKKADEYEKLSHLCLKQKNIQLALEYCGKAVKIRQSHFGENHPITTKSLNLFTVIYAEMGKEQYSAAMKKFSGAQEQAKSGPQPGSSKEGSSEGQQENDTHQTQSQKFGDHATRTAEENTGQKDKDQPAEDPRTGDEMDSQQPGQFRSVDRTLVWFFIFTVMLGVLVAVLLNNVSQRDLQAMYRYTVTRIKYFYYFHFRQAPKGDKFF